MRAMFSRLTPFYLMSEDEAQDSDGFDAYPVEIDSEIVTLCENLRDIKRLMDEKFDEMPAPEELTQEEADYLAALLKMLELPTPPVEKSRYGF
jgi:hypothetical protein